MSGPRERNPAPVASESVWHTPQHLRRRSSTKRQRGARSRRRERPRQQAPAFQRARLDNTIPASDRVRASLRAQTQAWRVHLYQLEILRALEGVAALQGHGVVVANKGLKIADVLELASRAGHELVVAGKNARTHTCIVYASILP